MMRKARGFSALEFIVICTIIAGIVWALIPRITDTLKLAHEQAVMNTGIALQENVQWAQRKWLAAANHPNVIDWPNTASRTLMLNTAGFPIGGPEHANENTLSALRCAWLWQGLLGGSPPAAAISGDSAYRVLTDYQPEQGLGCLYRYRLAGTMSIRYYPDTGTVLIDHRFESEIDKR